MTVVREQLHVRRRGRDVHVRHPEGGQIVVQCRNVHVAKDVEQLIKAPELQGLSFDDFLEAFRSKFSTFQQTYQERMTPTHGPDKAADMASKLVTVRVPPGNGG